MESPVEQVEVGDRVEVRRGRHTGATGFVVSVERSAGTLTFISLGNVNYKVPIDMVSFTPDHRALQFTPERGYNVKQGDTVIVVRGDYKGSCGTVTRVSLENKVLEVAPPGNPGVSNIHVVVGITAHLQSISILSNSLSPASRMLLPPVIVMKISVTSGKSC